MLLVFGFVYPTIMKLDHYIIWSFGSFWYWTEFTGLTLLIRFRKLRGSRRFMVQAWSVQRRRWQGCLAILVLCLSSQNTELTASEPPSNAIWKFRTMLMRSKCWTFSSQRLHQASRMSWGAWSICVCREGSPTNQLIHRKIPLSFVPRPSAASQRSAMIFVVFVARNSPLSPHPDALFVVWEALRDRILLRGRCRRHLGELQSLVFSTFMYSFFCRGRAEEAKEVYFASVIKISGQCMSFCWSGWRESSLFFHL